MVSAEKVRTDRLYMFSNTPFAYSISLSTLIGQQVSSGTGIWALIPFHKIQDIKVALASISISLSITVSK